MCGSNQRHLHYALSCIIQTEVMTKTNNNAAIRFFLRDTKGALIEWQICVIKIPWIYHLHFFGQNFKIKSAKSPSITIIREKFARMWSGLTELLMEGVFFCGRNSLILLFNFMQMYMYMIHTFYVDDKGSGFVFSRCNRPRGGYCGRM